MVELCPARLAVVLAAGPLRHFWSGLGVLLRTDVAATSASVTDSSRRQIRTVEPRARSAAAPGSVRAQPFNHAEKAAAEVVIRLQMMPFLGVCSALTTRSPPYG